MQLLHRLVPSIEASKVIGHKREAEAGTIGVLGRPGIRFVGKWSQILRRDDLLEKPGAPFSTPPLERELQLSQFHGGNGGSKLTHFEKSLSWRG